MDVTVLMPVYNREKYVAEAIGSILRQTFSDFSFLIYDDGSTDNTVNIIESFNDPRIRLIKGSVNKGVSFARNILLGECDTKYAAWQDSDDLSSIYRLAMQYQEMGNADMIYTRYARLDIVNASAYQHRPIPQISNHTANASVMFVVDKKIPFNVSLKIGEDVDWHHRMIVKYKESFLNYILYYIRYHDDRLSVKYRGYKRG